MSVSQMAKISCYTSFSYSYLSRARALVASLRINHPDWEIWALLVDQAPDGVDPSKALEDFDFVMNAADLGIPRYLPWVFKHDVVEACTAVKGHMMVYLLERGATKVVYFDPDIVIFSPIDVVISKLDQYSIILTPHQTKPNSTDMAIRDNEITALLYGVFNLGFIAVSNDKNGRGFADWWSRQLYRACYDEIGSGIFTDQKYCDLVPALFDNVHVERDDGCNVASWNLSRRKIHFVGNGGGQIVVNETLLKFYHFTKFGAIGEGMTERYGGDNVEVYELWNWYKRELQSKEIEGIPAGYWAYSKFSNGISIEKSARILFRNRIDLRDFFENPFDVSGNSFYEWLIREVLIPDPND